MRFEGRSALVTGEDDVARAVGAAGDALHVLVNNAGAGGAGAVADIDEALAAIPGQVAFGFGSICRNPSRFRDDRAAFRGLVPGRRRARQRALSAAPSGARTSEKAASAASTSAAVVAGLMRAIAWKGVRSTPRLSSARWT